MHSKKSLLFLTILLFNQISIISSYNPLPHFHLNSPSNNPSNIIKRTSRTHTPINTHTFHSRAGSKLRVWDHNIETAAKVVDETPLHASSSSVQKKAIVPHFTALQIGAKVRISLPSSSHVLAEFYDDVENYNYDYENDESSLQNPSKKAWKKRRRSTSPMLLPVKPNTLPLSHSVQSNLEWLVRKYGSSSSLGLAIDLRNLVKVFARDFNVDLNVHAVKLGFENVGGLLESLFPVLDEYNLSRQYRIYYSPSTEMLVAPGIKLNEGRSLTSYSQTCLSECIYGASEEGDLLLTGYTKVSGGNGKQKELLPLGFALRVPSPLTKLSVKNKKQYQKLTDGETVDAYVSSIEGSDNDDFEPLVTLSLEPPKYTREETKLHWQFRGASKYMNTDANQKSQSSPIKNFTSLSIGTKLTGTIVKVSTRSRAVFVDCGVVRTVGVNRGGGEERVLGMLRFLDMVDGVQETGEDDSEGEGHVYSDSCEHNHDDDNDDVDEEDDDDEDEEDRVLDVNESNGELSYVDEDGVKHVVGSMPDGKEDDDEAHDEDEVSDDDDTDKDRISPNDPIFAGMTDQEKVAAASKMFGAGIKVKPESTPSQLQPQLQTDLPTELTEGSTVTCYVKSILRQSGRFMLTLDSSQSLSTSSSNGEGFKEAKHQSAVEKRIEKLTKSNVMQSIVGSKGVETTGVIKTISKNQKFIYVQCDDSRNLDLPIGVGEYKGEDVQPVFKPGDKVRVRCEGLDEGRGQLGVSVLGLC